MGFHLCPRSIRHDTTHPNPCSSLGVVLISVLLIFVPVYELPDIRTAESGWHSGNKAISIANNALLMLLNGAVGVFALVAIFLYRNRTSGAHR